MTDLDDLLAEVAIRTNRYGRWTGDYKLTISDPDLAKELAAAVRALRDRPCPHIETGDDGTAFCTLAESANTAWADRWQQQHDRTEAEIGSALSQLRDHVHHVHDYLDGANWAVLIGALHRLEAALDRPGGTDNPTSEDRCEDRCEVCGTDLESHTHDEAMYCGHQLYLAGGPTPTGGDDGR